MVVVTFSLIAAPEGAAAGAEEAAAARWVEEEEKEGELETGHPQRSLLRVKVRLRRSGRGRDVMGLP